jgi:hypothetical protein
MTEGNVVIEGHGYLHEVGRLPFMKNLDTVAVNDGIFNGGSFLESGRGRKQLVIDGQV